MCNGARSERSGTVRTTRTEPTTRRMTSKPSAGLPPANEKYKRRTAYLDTSIQRDGSDAGRRE